jgi:nickel-type superoxide dismutase maturation protease
VDHRELIRALPELALWALGRRIRYRVRGASMEPALADGGFVLVNPRAYRGRAPRRGDIVLARHPFRTDVRLFKRVQDLPREGRIALAGDRADASTDSRDFGTVALVDVMGRVVLRLR